MDYKNIRGFDCCGIACSTTTIASNTTTTTVCSSSSIDNGRSNSSSSIAMLPPPAAAKKKYKCATNRPHHHHHIIAAISSLQYKNGWRFFAHKNNNIAIAITTAILLNYFNLMLKYSFMKTFFFTYNLFDLIFSNWNSGALLFIICPLALSLSACVCASAFMWFYFNFFFVILYACGGANKNAIHKNIDQHYRQW